MSLSEYAFEMEWVDEGSAPVVPSHPRVVEELVENTSVFVPERWCARTHSPTCVATSSEKWCDFHSKLDYSALETVSRQTANAIAAGSTPASSAMIRVA